MKIVYDRNVGTTMSFSSSEVKVALSVLRAMYKVTRAGFIHNAIEEMELDLKPRKLPFTNYFHWCIKCGRDIDERDENSINISDENDSKWQCRTCKPLKQNRPQ